MKWFNATDFRSRLFLAASLPAVLVALVLGALWLNWTQGVLESSLRVKAEAMARQLAVSAEFPLYTLDLPALAMQVGAQFKSDSELAGLLVTDERGMPLVGAGQAQHTSNAVPVAPGWSTSMQGKALRLVHPIVAPSLEIDPVSDGLEAPAADPGKPLGYVVMEVSLKRLEQARNDMLFIGAIAVLLSVLAGVFLSVRLARSVTDPLSKVISGVEAVSLGNTDVRIDVEQDCVLLPLVQGFNHLAENVALTQNELQSRIDVATEQLRLQKSAAEQEARIDPLTGLPNRRALMERAGDEVLRAHRYGTGLSVIMVDIDFFKNINDTHGHPVGDQVLQALADVLRHALREVDFVARTGGEEFVLLIVETPADEAVHAAERIRRDVEACRVEVDSLTLRLTASFGVTALTDADCNIDSVLARADAALYNAKRSGRNRVELLSEGFECAEGPAVQIPLPLHGDGVGEARGTPAA